MGKFDSILFSQTSSNTRMIRGFCKWEKSATLSWLTLFVLSHPSSCSHTHKHPAQGTNRLVLRSTPPSPRRVQQSIHATISPCAGYPSGCCDHRYPVGFPCCHRQRSRVMSSRSRVAFHPSSRSACPKPESSSCCVHGRIHGRSRLACLLTPDKTDGPCWGRSRPRRGPPGGAPR